MARGIYGWFVARGSKAPLVYVGQAKVIERRRLTYLREWAAADGKLTTNTRLAAAVKKYGAEAVSFRVLELVEDPGLLTERERYWYWHYKDLEQHGHYRVANFVEPGENPMTSEEARRRHAEAQAELGKRRSSDPAWLALQAEAGRRRSASPVWLEANRKAKAARAKTYIFRSPEGERVVVVNLTAFCRERGFNTGSMLLVQQGKRRSYKGWQKEEE